MKYRLLDYYRKKENEGKDLFQSVLEARKVNDIERLMSVTEEEIFHPSLMRNMDRASQKLLEHIEKESNIVFLGDTDTDGITSASTGVNYIVDKFNYPRDKIKIVFNKDKQHGIKPERIAEMTEGFDFQLLVVPDAGTNDTKAQREFKKKGIDVIILDHHHSDKKRFPAIVVNPNQVLCEYPNKELSGAGVVYKLCKYIDEVIIDSDNKVAQRANNDVCADDYLDIVTLGLVGDAMDLRSYETRYLCLKGIEIMQEARDKIHEKVQDAFDEEKKYPYKDFMKLAHYLPDGINPLIAEIMRQSTDYDFATVNFYAISWNIVPFFNACVRCGTDEEMNDIYEALTGDNKEVIEKISRASKFFPEKGMIPMSFAQRTFRKMKSIRSAQLRQVDKVMSAFEDRIIEEELYKNQFIVVSGEGIMNNPSLSGLIAQKIAEKHMKGCAVLKPSDNNRWYGGSGRNYSSLSIIESTKQLLHDTGCFHKDLLNMGHDNAHGIRIRKTKVKEARKRLDELLDGLDFSNIYPVDAVIPFGRLRPTDITRIGKYEDIWGNGIPKPMFAVTNVMLNVDDIQLVGAQGRTIMIKKRGMKFIKSRIAKGELDKMRMDEDKEGFNPNPVKSVILDMIVYFEVDEYGGDTSPIMRIVDYNVRKNDSLEFDFGDMTDEDESDDESLGLDDVKESVLKDILGLEQE